MELKYTQVLTPEDVYMEIPTIPDGYVLAGFAPPIEGDQYLTLIGDIAAAGYWQGKSPRLILRKNAKKRYLVVKFEIADPFKVVNSVTSSYATERVQEDPSRYSIVEEEC